jgi:hypothetical protein
MKLRRSALPVDSRQTFPLQEEGDFEPYLLPRQLLLKISYAIMQTGEPVDLVLVLACDFCVRGVGFVLFRELGTICQ